MRNQFVAIAGLIGAFTAAMAASDHSSMVARDLIEVRGLSGVAISPDGEVAVVRLDYADSLENVMKLTWHLVPLNGRDTPQPLVDGGEPIWNSGGILTEEQPQWSPDSRWIYFRSLKGEEAQVWRIARDGSQLEQITRDEANVISFVLNPTGRKLFYLVKATREEIEREEAREDREGVVLDEFVDAHDAVVRNFPHLGRMTTLRRDLAHSFYPLLTNAHPRIKVLDVDTREVHEADAAEIEEYHQLNGESDPPPRTDIASWRQRPVGNGVAFFQEVVGATTSQKGDAGAQGNLELELRWSKSGDVSRSVTCTKPLCRDANLKDLRWTASGREIVFISQDRLGFTVLGVWDVIGGAVREVFSGFESIGAGSGESRFGSRLCPTVGRRAICTTASASGPPRLESIDLASGRRHVLFDPNDGLRRELAAHALVEHVTWKDKWGYDGAGVLLTPKVRRVGERLPLVITSYRCRGFLLGGTGATVSEHLLVSKGFAVLCVDAGISMVNGKLVGKLTLKHPSSEVAPGQHTFLQWLVDDWEGAIQHLSQRGVIDPDRVGVSGLSLTGEGVTYAVAHSSAFRAAASAHATMLDPINYYSTVARGELGRFALNNYGMPNPEKDNTDYYKKASPALNVHRVTTPLLLQVAESEFRGGIQFYANMKEAGKPLEFIVFPQEGHQFMQPVHRLVINERNVDWFQFWLLGREDPAAEKVRQYERWRALRKLQEARKDDAS